MGIWTVSFLIKPWFILFCLQTPENLVSACGVGFDGSHMHAAQRLYETGVLRKCESAFKHRGPNFLGLNHSKFCYRRFRNKDGVDYGYESSILWAAL